ncbi:MAG: hypothetical protein ABH842_04270 [Candidatus Micrarchaeota archaeon]
MRTTISKKMNGAKRMIDMIFKIDEEDDFDENDDSEDEWTDEEDD